MLAADRREQGLGKQSGLVEKPLVISCGRVINAVAAPFAVVTMFGWLGSPVRAQTPDATEIFERARDAWSAVEYPKRISYVIAVHVTQGSQTLANHYRAEFVPNDKDLWVGRFSAEELAHPFVPHGINVVFGFTIDGQGFTKQLNPPSPPTDYLGVPLLEPTYAFGMRRKTAALSTAPDAAAGAGQYRTIGRVLANARDYAITYFGIESVNDAPAYHLSLRPLREPRRNRLRDLWIDTVSSRTLKLRVDGNFTDAMTVGVPWTITFSTIDGVPYISSETADEPLKRGRRTEYDTARVSFENLEVSSSVESRNLMFHLPDPDGALAEPSP